MKKEKFKIIYSDLEISNLINDEKLYENLYINPDKNCIESFETTETVDKKMIKIPTREELCPYNQLMHEYVKDMEIPLNESASHYLKRNNFMQDFYNVQNEKAVEALEQWLQKQKIQIVVTD